MGLKKAYAVFVVLIVVGIVLAFSTSGALSSLSASQTLASTGTLTQVETSVNLGIFGNAACSVDASFVDWGALEPGDSVEKVVWIKNLGTSDVLLSMCTKDWSPSNAFPDINLTWNREGVRIASGEVVQATMTLTVSEDIDSSITSFSFNIMITGTV